MIEELNKRRESLLNKMSENSVAIIFAGVGKIKSEDENFPFLANRNFFYLTNIEQENSILMLIKGISDFKTYLFVDEFDEVKEKWTGRRLTFQQASTLSGIQNVYSTSSFENMVKLALTSANNQYGKISTLFLDFSPELKIKENYYIKDYIYFIKCEYPHIKIEDIYSMIVSLRMVKSSIEVEKIMHAIRDTSNGIVQLLTKVKPGIKEHDLSDFFEYFGKTIGCKELAFSTISASGKNGTCLHYPSQNDILQDGELILFDLGYKYEGYCADISRTYPISGKFVGKQRDIYEAVLNTNKAIIDYVKEGMTLTELQDFTKAYLKNECVRLNLLKPDDDIWKYYFHRISHHLGLDTHDVSIKEKPLENGNIITVEPGLYFEELGIGVRIEDDVLICNGKCECLSKSIPKEIKDIELIFESKGKI